MRNLHFQQLERGNTQGHASLGVKQNSKIKNIAETKINTVICGDGRDNIMVLLIQTLQNLPKYSKERVGLTAFIISVNLSAKNKSFGQYVLLQTAHLQCNTIILHKVIFRILDLY